MTTYGLQLPDFAPPGTPGPNLLAALAAMAAAAEESGFSSIWVMGSMPAPPLFDPAPGSRLEPYTVLGALAARTRRATLGALVTPVTSRPPGVLAKQATTLDVISSGRAVLGIGTGGEESPARLARVGEAVGVCRALFRERAPVHGGRWYSLDRPPNLPRPVTPGGPPVVVRCASDAALTLAAGTADACCIAGGPAATRRQLAHIAGHCRRGGRQPGSLRTLRTGSLVLCADPAEARRVVAEVAPAYGGLPALSDQAVVAGAEEAAERIADLAGTGVDELVFNLPRARSASDVAAAGELLAAVLTAAR